MAQMHHPPFSVVAFLASLGVLVSPATSAVAQTDPRTSNAGRPQEPPAKSTLASVGTTSSEPHTHDTAETVSQSDDAPLSLTSDRKQRPSWRTQLLEICDVDCLTGEWGGLRLKLVEKGITLNLEYVSTVFVNTQGGLNTNRAIEYTGNTHLTLSLDTAVLGWWEGGEFFIYAEERHGSGMTERHVGDLFVFNNDEDRDFLQVSEYWWHQSLFDDKVWFKIGKMDGAADFQVVEYGLEFINSAFAVIPMIPIPTFPDTALGAVAAIEPTDWLYFMAGIYDQQAFGGNSGFGTAFHDRNDSVTLFELALMPELKAAGRSYPGTYRVGGWFTSGDEDKFFDDLGGRLRPRSHRGNSGVYLAFDQLVFKENDDPGDSQGIGAFFQFGWAPSSYNEISQYYGAGIQCTGLIPSRDEDIMGLAVGHASLSGRVQSLEARHNETAVEWFYKAQIFDWLSVMPDLQYIFNPGGDGPDAFVIGLRTQISF